MRISRRTKWHQFEQLAAQDFHWTDHEVTRFAAIGYVVVLCAAHMMRSIGVGIAVVVDLCANVATIPARRRLTAPSPRR